MHVWRSLALVGAIVVTARPRPRDRADRRGGGSLLHGPITVGPRVGRDFENHAWSVGGQISIPMGKRLELRPSGDLFFPKDGETGVAGQRRRGHPPRPRRRALRRRRLAFAIRAAARPRPVTTCSSGSAPPPPEQTLKPFIEFRWTFVNDTSPFRLALGFTTAL